MGKTSRGRSKSNIPTLDLHGYKTADVPAALDAFLVKHQNRAQIRVMPGKGQGKVKAVVEKYLKTGHYPFSYEVLESGQTNQGVLIVHMD